MYPIQNDEILTVADAAQISKCHPNTISFALRTGDLYGTQRVPRGRWFIRRSALDRWIDGLPPAPRLR